MPDSTTYACENCEGLFCYVCDEDAERCTLRCGRNYCGDCRRLGVTCACSSDDDE